MRRLPALSTAGDITLLIAGTDKSTLCAGRNGQAGGRCGKYDGQTVPERNAEMRVFHLEGGDFSSQREIVLDKGERGLPWNGSRRKRIFRVM